MMGEISGLDADGLKKFSCSECRTRKIRCNRRNPCSNCVKATRHCSFVPPVRGKRPRTKVPKEGLHARLRRYEELLKSYGVQIDPSDCGNDGDSDLGTASLPEIDMAEDADPSNAEWKKPDVTNKQALSKRFDSSLWSNLGKEFPYPEDDSALATDDSIMHESDLLLHSPQQHCPPAHTQSSSEPLENLHPPYPILLKLWDIYVDRIDPLMKILHLPTFWSSLVHTINYPQDVSTNLEALICAFYLTVVSALDQDECNALLGCPKSVIFSRYERAARRALVSVGFLHTSSVMTLRAYTVFLSAVMTRYRNDTMFILSGVAVRLARKLDIHQDGSALGLSPFEAEMRRRLWWHIFHLDFRLSDLMNAKPSMDIFSGNTGMPLNAPDEDLSPEMVQLPPERSGITPVVISLLRCEVAEFLRQFMSPGLNDFSWETLTNPDTIIQRLEDRLETRYLRYCDPANTLHHLVSLMVRTILCKIRLYAHNPRRYANMGVKVPESERDIIFANASKMLEYAIVIRENPSFNKYTWQIGASFLWNALLYVLIETRHRKVGPEVDRLWPLIGVVFSHYPQVFEETPRAVYTVLRNWTLEVWDDCLAASKAQGFPEPSTPEYITAIRQRRTSRSEPTSIQENSTGVDLATGNGRHVGNMQATTHDPQLLSSLVPLASCDFPNLLSLEMDADNWVQWDALVGGEGSLQTNVLY